MLIRWSLAGFLALHGLIHVMGFAKAFGYADLPQLTTPISRPWGVAWFLAAMVTVAAAVMLAAGSRHFWFVGTVAMVLSQAVISTAWRDARFGTAANIVLLALVVHAWLTTGPTSFAAELRRDTAVGMARLAHQAVVTDADLAPLPDPVRRYLRLAGVVGQPRVQNYRLRFHGRIRSAADAEWMPFEAEQMSFADEPTRLFLMRARMRGLPVEAFHRSVGGHATMRVKVLGAVTMVDARGPVMDKSEAVTLFNDMCLLAPATLLDRRIHWEAVDGKTARATFELGEQAIAATLFFDDEGRLVDFVSDDRSQLSADGKSFASRRFSTPVRDYKPFGPTRLASRGEARFDAPTGAFTYGEFDLVDVVYNVVR